MRVIDSANFYWNRINEFYISPTPNVDFLDVDLNFQRNPDKVKLIHTVIWSNTKNDSVIFPKTNSSPFFPCRRLSPIGEGLFVFQLKEYALLVVISYNAWIFATVRQTFCTTYRKFLSFVLALRVFEDITFGSDFFIIVSYGWKINTQALQQKKKLSINFRFNAKKHTAKVVQFRSTNKQDKASLSQVWWSTNWCHRGALLTKWQTSQRQRNHMIPYKPKIFSFLKIKGKGLSEMESMGTLMSTSTRWSPTIYWCDARYKKNQNSYFTRLTQTAEIHWLMKMLLKMPWQTTQII